MEAFKIKNGISATRYLGSNGTETAGSAGYDLAGAVYDSKSFSVASQESNFLAFYIDNSGTKLFVVGYANDTVYQYTLSTAWDISSASYDSKSFSVASQMTVPRALEFKPDGTKMYVGEYPTIYQYSLSTAFDVSTASYDSVSFSPSSQTSTLHEVVLAPDGTKMYITGLNEDSLFQYTLSTAYDLSTASYASKSLSVSSQDGTPYGFAFNSDGTKAYVSGGNTYSVYEYSLTTAYDISTGSYSGNSFDASAQGANNQFDIVFKYDGTKMYLGGLGTDTLYQYSTQALTQTLDLSTGTTFSFTPSGATTVSFTNPPASGNAIGFSVEIIGDGSAITWPSSVKWDLATAPTATASKELYTFVTTDGGTTYYGKKAAEGVA